MEHMHKGEDTDMKRYLSWLPGIVIICLLGWSGSGLAKMAVAPVVEDGPGVVENRRAWPLFFEAMAAVF